MNGHIARQWFEPVPGTMLLLDPRLPDEKKEAAKEAWDKLQPVVKSVLYHCSTDIIVENEESQDEAAGILRHWPPAELETKSGTRTLTDPGGEIHIYAKDATPEEMRGTIWHECGHSFDLQAYRFAYGRPLSDTQWWKDAYKKEYKEILNTDSSTLNNVWKNEEEELAEVYRLLQEGNESVRKLAPESAYILDGSLEICEEKYKTHGLLVAEENMARKRMGNGVAWEYSDGEKEAIGGLKVLIEDVKNGRETDPDRIADRFDKCCENLGDVQNINKRGQETIYAAACCLEELTKKSPSAEERLEEVEFYFKQPERHEKKQGKGPDSQQMQKIQKYVQNVVKGKEPGGDALDGELADFTEKCFRSGDAVRVSTFYSMIAQADALIGKEGFSIKLMEDGSFSPIVVDNIEGIALSANEGGFTLTQKGEGNAASLTAKSRFTENPAEFLFCTPEFAERMKTLEIGAKPQSVFHFAQKTLKKGFSFAEGFKGEAPSADER